MISKLEKTIGAPPSMTTLLDMGLTPEDIVRKVLDGFEVEIMERIPTAFYCNCSKSRVEKAIISIGKKEIEEMIRDGKPIEVNCHFCNSHYIFSVEELKTILKKAL